MAETIQREAGREVATLLEVVFSGLRKSGHFDPEAVEMATRAATHQPGAKMLERLLNTPAEFDRDIPCPCGGRARFHQMRPKHLVTVLGPVAIERPCYLCAACHKGQSPRDVELDADGTEYSPGVRRMMAVVGSETSFERGRAQLELLAGIDVTAKAVERNAEAIGDDIAQIEKARGVRALHLELPAVLGPAHPIPCIEMDGAQVPMVRAELEGRAGRTEGKPPRTRSQDRRCLHPDGNRRTRPTGTRRSLNHLYSGD
jgi:hypothetical protein